jgi:hypothetical protein
MNGPIAQRLAAMAATACLVCAACRKEPTPKASPAPAPIVSAAGADRLLPGELAEGTEKVFGLVLPRDLRIERAFDDSALAKSTLRPEPIAHYVRARVEGGNVEVGVARTVFNDAHVKGAPSGKRVRIEVALDDTITIVVIRDATPPPPPPPGLSEEELWRRTGIGKNGKILDPAQTQ